MIDVFNLTDSNLNQQVFYANGDIPAATNTWQTWQKPKNCKFISFFVLGGGSGGGYGGSGAANAAGGGGGGGSSAFTKGIFMASVLPDILYIMVGRGGAGGRAIGVTNAEAGSISRVAIAPSTTAGNVILASGAVAPTAGGNGANGGGAGTAGASGTAFSQAAANYLSFLGIVQVFAGQAGTAGSSIGLAVTNVTPTHMFSGGAGGGGVTAGGTGTAGGSINSSGYIPSIVGGANTSGALNFPGDPGYTVFTSTANTIARLPFTAMGGAGGGAADSAAAALQASDGGPARFGSGGGGGGGTYAGFGGRGGDGGNGVVIITAF